MIKEVLQQLEPLDAQIDALCSRADDAEMASTTTHAAELAELSAEENTLLQRCTSLTPEDRVFLARRPDRPHITEMIDNLFTDFFEQCGSTGCPLPFWGTAKGLRWKKTCAATLACRDRRATARPCA